MAYGVDFAFSPHPGVAAMRQAGVKFVGRYVSPQAANDANGKNISRAEVAAYHAAGLSLILYAEQYAGRMKEGRSAGVADAKHFDGVARALHLASIVMYCAADFDATPGDQVGINAYLDGAASVVGRGRTGIYGGYYPVKRALDAGKARYAVQTIAWSGGQWDDRAHVRQGLYVNIGGVSCDVLHSMKGDYGQYPRPAHGPTPAPAKPVKMVADGHTSLRDAVHAHSTTVARAVYLMARDPAHDKTHRMGKIQRPYIARGDWDVNMPKGMSYWVG